MRALIRRWLGVPEVAEAGAGPVLLKRGGVYAVQSAVELSRVEIEAAEAYFAKVTRRTGCEFVILDKGCRVQTSEAEE